MLLAILIAATHAVPPEASIAEAVADQAAREQLVESVEGVLLADNDLAFQHTGYKTFWFGRSDWEQAETAHAAMHRSARLSPLLSAFDEALIASPRADVAYASFRSTLADRPELRVGVEALEDSGLQWTMERLDRVIGPAQAADADPIARLQDLLGPDHKTAIRQLATDPSAKRSLDPWWRFQYETPGVSAGPAYNDLLEALRETPGGLAAWRNREALMAAEPDDAAWVRYWHRRVRRTKGLGPRYYDYLATVQERPELVEANELAFRKAAAGRSWPPPGEPPRFNAMMNDDDERPRGDLRLRHAPSVERSSKPNTPERPVRPTRPVRGGSTRPDTDDRRPAKPERPTPPKRNSAAGAAP